MFTSHDVNGDGHLDAREFSNVLNSCGIDVTKAETLRLLRKYDLDGDNSISYGEFMKAFLSK